MKVFVDARARFDVESKGPISIILYLPQCSLRDPSIDACPDRSWRESARNVACRGRNSPTNAEYLQQESNTNEAILQICRRMKQRTGGELHEPEPT